MYAIRSYYEYSIWVWDLDQTEPRSLVGPVNDLFPSLFWSPDSNSLGFRERYELKRIAVSGGPPTTIAAVSMEGINFGGASWSSDGESIIFTLNTGGGPGLYQVPAKGGTPEPIRKAA